MRVFFFTLLIIKTSQNQTPDLYHDMTLAPNPVHM